MGPPKGSVDGGGGSFVADFSWESRSDNAPQLASKLPVLPCGCLSSLEGDASTIGGESEAGDTEGGDVSAKGLGGGFLDADVLNWESRLDSAPQSA